MSAGQFLGKIFQDHEKKAKEEQDKFDQSRQEDIRMYQKVLLSPPGTVSEEQRTKAANEIAKLRNLKGKETPIHKLAGLLNIFGGAHKANEEGSKKPLGGETSGFPSGQSPLDKAGAISELEKPAAPKADPDIPPAKKNIIQRGLTKLTHGLGQSPSRTLPPLNTSVFPTGEQVASSEFQSQYPMKRYREALKANAPSMSEQDLDRAVETKFGALPKPTTTGHSFSKKGTVFGNEIPEGEKDALGNPIDKSRAYDVLENASGEKQYIPFAEKVSTTERPMIDVNTGRMEKVPFTRKSGVAKPSQSNQTSPKGPQGSNGSKSYSRSLSPLTGQPSATAKHPGEQSNSKPQHVLVPPAQANQLRKEANSVEEARNSLLGDDPKKVEGLAGDLDVFKNPDSVKRLSNYIGFINGRLEEQGRMSTGSGPFAAVEWYAGVPQLVSNLQQEAQRKYSESLTPEEQRFVADYYRGIGTIGGMRAVTGASAAKWSFKNLYSEFPTPGPVTSYSEAVRRIKNFVRETNIPAKRNPALSNIDADKAFDGHGEDELENFYKKYPELRPPKK